MSVRSASRADNFGLASRKLWIAFAALLLLAWVNGTIFEGRLASTASNAAVGADADALRPASSVNAQPGSWGWYRHTDDGGVYQKMVMNNFYTWSVSGGKVTLAETQKLQQGSSGPGESSCAPTTTVYGDYFQTVTRQGGEVIGVVTEFIGNQLEVIPCGG